MSKPHLERLASLYAAVGVDIADVKDPTMVIFNRCYKTPPVIKAMDEANNYMFAHRDAIKAELVA